MESKRRSFAKTICRAAYPNENRRIAKPRWSRMPRVSRTPRGATGCCTGLQWRKRSVPTARTPRSGRMRYLLDNVGTATTVIRTRSTQTASRLLYGINLSFEPAKTKRPCRRQQSPAPRRQATGSDEPHFAKAQFQKGERTNNYQQVRHRGVRVRSADLKPARQNRYNSRRMTQTHRRRTSRSRFPARQGCAHRFHGESRQSSRPPIR